MTINRNMFVFFAVFVFITGVSNNFAQQSPENELQEIVFLGNNEFSSSVLKTKILSVETPSKIMKFLDSFTSFGKGASYFDSTNIPIDIAALGSFYHANGFFNVTVSHAIQHSKIGTVLTYIIQEGQQYTIGTATFYGLDSLPKEDFFKPENFISIDSTLRFSQERLEQQSADFIFSLVNNGYMFAKLDSILVLRDTILLTTDLELFYKTGNRYRFDYITVNKSGEGSESVNDELVYKFVNIKPNSYYNIDRLKIAQSRLYKTGLFTSVLISPNTEAATDTLMPLEVTCTIDNMNELNPQIIANNQQNTFFIGLTTEYLRKNFFGEARKATLEGQIGLQDVLHLKSPNIFRLFDPNDTTMFGYYSISAKLEQPNLFGEPVEGSLEFSNGTYKSKLLSYSVYSAKLNINFDLQPTVFLNYANAFYKIDKIDIWQTGYRNAAILTYLNAGLGFDIRALHGSDLVFPKSGFTQILSAEEGNLFPFLIARVTGDTFTRPLWQKTLISSALYFPLNQIGNWVLAIDGKIGNIQIFEKSLGDVNPVYRFFSGGTSSIRGWGQRELGPKYKAGDYDSFFADQGIVKGGAFLFETSLELRNRLNEYFGAAFFLDYGNTWWSINEFNLNQAALAAGFGARVYTPYLSVRLDFGFKLHDPDNVRSVLTKRFFDVMQIQFGIGEAF